MKIEHLEIKNYKQFTDLTLDLTYPRGHEKEGQPLDKICIIGQSGTGKTNLLEIIKKSSLDFSEQLKNSYLPFSEFVGKDGDDQYINTRLKTQNDYYGEGLFSTTESSVTIYNDSELDNCLEHEKNYFFGNGIEESVVLSKEENKTSIEERMSKSDKSFLQELEDLKRELTIQSLKETNVNNSYDYLTNSAMKQFELISGTRKAETVEEKLGEVNRHIRSIYTKYKNQTSPVEKLKSKNFINRNIININEENNTWELLKEKIDNYEKRKNDYTKKLFNKIMHEANYSKEQSIDEMKKWEKNNESILEKIAENINSIIKKFNLELQIDENTHSYEELVIKDLSNGNILNYDNLSTGTKNLLSTFIPLKSYNPKDSIILIDEPENSFYPDIQRELTDLYMNIGENNQLIMATHSPLIASSFEPWEVVELKFNDNNQVYREAYYPKEEENHVDNYTLDPRMLTWTSILVDIFDLKEDSFSLREEKLMAYGMLKAEIKGMEKGEDRDIKIKEFKKLSSLLGLQN